MEFLILSGIVLIVSFDADRVQERLNGVDVGSAPRHLPDGFDFQWYYYYARRIPLFLLIGVAIYNLFDLVKFLWVLCQRWRDRKYKMNLAKDPDDPQNDEPNSRMRMQSELEKLYSGSQFNLERAYTRMMSPLFLIISYSSGVPILYMFGAIYFGITYMV